MTHETIRIEELTPDSETLWEEYVRNHPEGSFYHRLFWRDLFQTSFRYQPHYLIARDGPIAAGIMPLFKIPTLRGSLMTSIPFRDRAAPLADNPEVLGKLLRKAIHVSERLDCKALLIKSAVPFSLQGDLANLFLHSSDWIRSLVRLPSDQPTYWQKINDKTRNMIRQAERSGLEFSLISEDASAIDEAVSVLENTQHRLGIPPFPRSFYLDLTTILSDGQLGEVCAVRYRAKIIAAAILFFETDSAVYAYAGSLPAEAWPLRANDLLVWNALGTAIDRGKGTFDFGSDSARQKQLLFFKKKWGAEQKPLHYYSHTARLTNGRVYAWRDSSQGLYPLLRGVVRHMPAPIYNMTGLLTRYFG